MSESKCYICAKTKNLMECECCHSSVCKSCAEILPEDAFSFADTQTDLLTKKIFCNPCFNQEIQEPLNAYNEILDKAKDVNIYFDHQGKETRLMKRKEKSISIPDCADKEEILMRLAFKAAEKGFNTVLDVKVVGEKIRMGTYQTTKYKATGVPTQLEERLIVKDRSIWQNPN